MKSEFDDSPLEPSNVLPSVRTRTTVEMDMEVIKILSSDEEMDSVSVFSDFQSDMGPESLGGMDSDSDEESATIATDWLDPVITSRVVSGEMQITRQRRVKHVEYLDEIPSLWPVPRNAVAYVHCPQPPFPHFFWLACSICTLVLYHCLYASRI